MRKGKDPARQHFLFVTRELRRTKSYVAWRFLARQFLTAYREVPKHLRDEVSKNFMKNICDRE